MLGSGQQIRQVIKETRLRQYKLKYIYIKHMYLLGIYLHVVHIFHIHIALNPVLFYNIISTYIMIVDQASDINTQQ